MKKTLIALALIVSTAVTCVSAGTLDHVPVNFSPAATPVSLGIREVTPEILKLSWPTDGDTAYIVQYAPKLSSPWRPFSVERAVELTTSRSIVVDGSAGFYRLLKAAHFPAGANVNWQLDLPTLSSNELYACTATWLWENGESNVITGEAWKTPIVKTNLSTGLYRVSVSVSAPDQSKFIGCWAIMVTNPNLVVNGDLEITNGSLPLAWSSDGGWGTYTHTLSYPVQGPNGPADKAAQVSVTSFTDGDAYWYFDEVQINPGFRYAFEDDYRSAVLTDITWQIRNNQSNLSWDGIGRTVAASTNWTRKHVEFTAPSNAVSVTFFHGLVSTGSLTIDNVSLRQITPPTPLKEGMVSIDIDDGNQAAFFLATNTLWVKGFKATFYITTKWLGYYGTVGLGDLLEMQRLGHEVGSHSLTHPYLTTLSTEQQEREINQSGAYLRSLGISSVKAFSYPFGDYDEAGKVKRLAREAGYLLARTADEALNEKGVTDPYLYKAYSMTNHMTLDSVKSLIDQAKNNKSWLILLFHYYANSSEDPYTVTPAFFTNVVNYISDTGIKVVTASQGAALMSAP